MKINPACFRYYLERLVPRKPLAAIAQETGIEEEELRKALEEPVSFAYEELRKLGQALGVDSYWSV